MQQGPANSHHKRRTMATKSLTCFFCILAPGAVFAQSGLPYWAEYAGDLSHHANSPAPTQSLQRVLWSRPVDLMPQYSGDELLIHYGSPMITHENVILWPTKTGTTDGFRVEAHDATTGKWIYATSTDYSLPQGSSWI